MINLLNKVKTKGLWSADEGKILWCSKFDGGATLNTFQFSWKLTTKSRKKCMAGCLKLLLSRPKFQKSLKSDRVPGGAVTLNTQIPETVQSNLGPPWSSSGFGTFEFFSQKASKASTQHTDVPFSTFSGQISFSQTAVGTYSLIKVEYNLQIIAPFFHFIFRFVHERIFLRK